MDVDKTGREHRAVGVDLVVATLVDPADPRDAALAHHDVTGERWRTAAVDDGRAAHDEVGSASRHEPARAAARASTCASIP